MALNRNNVKQTPIPVVARNMAIVNSDGTPTRSGQLLLQQLQQSPVGYGAAGQASTGMPDGSYYTVQTGGETLYQFQNGEWHYVAGTIWGTLNPDQRPTGLGPNDTGLDFRTTDQPARQFLWSGSAWVEVDFVLYGTHADRLALVFANIIEGMLFVEDNRSGVIYQNQGGAWHYLAGTMWGTYVPDQRPTDLAVNDTGFTFRTTDNPAREFIWGGAAWVEVNFVRYGTHAARLAIVPASVIDGMLYIETDRGNGLYEIQAGTWKLLQATMWGTLTPDQRPTDLGVNDAGFEFWSTDVPGKKYIWTSSAWADMTPPTNPYPPTGSVQWNNSGAFGGSANLMWDNPNSRLGIGTASPVVALHVIGGGPEVLRVSDSASDSFQFYCGIGGTDNWIQAYKTSASTYNNLVLNAGSIILQAGGAERMRITAAGGIVIQNLPSANPGAGSKQLWYDPADANRVKFAP